MKKITLLFLLAVTGIYAQDTKFTAKIQNRNSDSIVISGQGGFKKTLKLNKDGIFSDSFKTTPNIYQLFDGVEYTLLFLKPGYDLNLNMDAKKFDESIVYTGAGSKENNWLAKKTLAEEALEGKLAAAKGEKELDETISGYASQLTASLDKDLDPAFTDIAKKMIKGETDQMKAQAASMAAAQKMNGNASALFDYENFKGGKTKLEDLRGKYVYIDVWATWCGPCRGEIPFLQKVEEKYKGKNIEFVSISVDVAKDHDKWKKMVADKNLGGSQLFADNNWNSAFVTAYGINAIPRFILIDPKGNVVNSDAARPSDPALQAQLDGLLK